MSAISLRHIKRDFSQVSYRPDIEDEDLADILRNILVTSGKLLTVSRTIRVNYTNKLIFQG